MNWTINIMQGLLLLFAAFGTFAGLRLTLDHLKVGEVCPMLGSVPACIIVCIGYSFVLVAALNHRKLWSTKLFYLGWIPVFLLALSGVVLELTRGQICPPGPVGIPQCFISLAMVSVAWILFIILRKLLNNQ